MFRSALMLGLAVLPGALCAAPESYTIDPRHTFPRWAVSHHGFSIHRGQFNKTTGRLVMDWSAKTGSVEIEVETASIGTGNPEFDKVLRSAGWFDTDKHPRMTYRSTSMRLRSSARNSE